MATIEEATGTGVSFALSDEQRSLRELARDFAEKEIRPKAADYDEHQTHAADIVEKAHSLGLMNLHVPESFGGLGLSAFDGMLVGEELNWGCSGIGTTLCANGLGAGPVILAGSEEQQATWLPPLLEEPLLCSFGLSEPEAGSDVVKLKTTAVRRGDEYVLNGSKTFITNAGKAAWTVVFAKTDPDKGHKGISAFIVPMDTPGVELEKHLEKMGQRATDTSAFALTDVVVPAENRLGEEGEGFTIAMRTLDFTRPGTAVGAVGRRAGRLRVRGRVREAARHLRRADRDAPGRQLHDRGHGDRDRGGAPARLAGGVAPRSGQARDAAVVVREAVRGRHGDEGDDRRRPGLRRLRLHEGVPGREADARREALPDLRGHVADPAARDREGDLPPAAARRSRQGRAGRAAGSPARSGRRRASRHARCLGVDRRAGVTADVLEQARARSRRLRAGSSRRRRGRPTRSSVRRCRSSRKASRPWGPRYQSRSFQPIVVGSSVGQERGRRARRTASARGRRRGHSRPRRRGRRRACGIAASAARASRAVQPAHQRMSASVAGPNAASQRLRSSACATATSSSSIGPPSQSSVVTQRNCGLIQVPRGRPRTSRPSIASCGRTRAPALCSTTQRPEPKRSFFDSSGTSATTSRVIASPRAATAARAAFPARVIHGPGRLETPLSRTKPSSRFRSRAATARVAAAKTTGTSSRGTAQSVRRMARRRTRLRSS